MAETVAETERLILREWDEPDEQRFYEVMNTPGVMQHLGGVQSSEGWRAGFERLRLYQREFGHTFWIVEDKASGEILGFCGLKLVNSPGAGDELEGMPEIGWRAPGARASPRKRRSPRSTSRSAGSATTVSSP